MDVQSDPVSLTDIAGSSKRKPVHKSRGWSLSLPKLKKIKRELLTDLPLKSHECQSEILPLVRKSFHWTTSPQTHEFKRVQSIHNPDLTAKYLERKRDMKSCGYPDSLVTDTFAFLMVENMSMVEKICRNGVRCGNQKSSGLGVSHMAVHLCKHADLLAPSKPAPGDKILLVVKVLKGKIKPVVCRTVGVQLEPTPNYDCHVAKPNTDLSVTMPPHLMFYSLQLYVYEYGDLGVEDYPKQVLPHAVVHYSTKELQPIAPHIPSCLPFMHGFAPKPQNGAKDPDTGPKNEIWKGRLHLRLIGGGHIYIDVSIFSHFVPLAITLLSPVKVSRTYPNTNAQLTFLAGLSDIANKPEVPWRDCFFRSFVMKPSTSSEVHFKALVRHISKKQEMVAVRLPKDVYLFLMPKCLLASQLGLVQGEDSSSILYCVLMSKVSTIKKHKNKLEKLVGGKAIRRCGKATSWGELFDDSDSEEKDASQNGESKLNPVSLGAMFEQQRLVQNRLAAMSLEEANNIFTPCSCGKRPSSSAEMQRRRNDDVQRVVTNIQAQLNSRHSRDSVKPRFPPGSRTKPRQRVSRHARAMASFSPHGSSESDSDEEVGGRRQHSRRGRNHLSILDNNKTVEEELSEEELTNEQMEAIIFMRKPTTTTTLSKPASSASHASQLQTEAKKPDQPESKADSPAKESPVLRTEPKIIPMEPLVDLDSDIASPTDDEVTTTCPVIIPTEPVSPPKPPKPRHSHKPNVEAAKPILPRPALPKSILKKSTSSAPVVSTSVPEPSNPFFPPPAMVIAVAVTEKALPEKALPALSHQNNMGDVDMRDVDMRDMDMRDMDMRDMDMRDMDMRDMDMRIPADHAVLSGPFSSAISPPVIKTDADSCFQSTNWSQGSWLAPGELPVSLDRNQLPLDRNQLPLDRNQLPNSDLSLPHSPSQSQHEMPASPDASPDASPPSNSPPSPCPLSPSFESLPPDSPPSPPSSPPPNTEMESPASPPQSNHLAGEFRSTPIAIPTVRVKHSDSSHVERDTRVVRLSRPSLALKSPHKSEAENADDMMEFLNSAATNFDSDSPFEDER